MRYKGEAYGVFAIPLHFADWALFKGRVVARRWSRNAEHPICSTLISRAWSAVGLHFGIAPYAAQPDDIHDYCQAHPVKYHPIWPVIE
jgi:hypothetical protein